MMDFQAMEEVDPDNRDLPDHNKSYYYYYYNSTMCQGLCQGLCQWFP